MDKILIWVLVFVLTVGLIKVCSGSELIIESPKEIPPIPLYQEAWEDILLCIPFTFSKYEDVRWFSTPYMEKNNIPLAGLWRHRGSEIYLLEPYVHDYDVIRHELLHHALSLTGYHFNPPFRRCDPLAT
jgi:hypothetical protein